MPQGFVSAGIRYHSEISPVEFPYLRNPTSSSTFTRCATRGTFFQIGLRGKRPGALLRRLNRSLYEGQLAGYLRFLHDREVASCSNRDCERQITIEYPVATTRGDRIGAAAVAGSALVCAYYVAHVLFILHAAAGMKSGFRLLLVYLMLSVVLSGFVVLGCICLTVAFGKE